MYPYVIHVSIFWVIDNLSSIWQNLKDFLVLNALQLCTLCGLFTFFDCSVTDESFVDETRIGRIYKISILVSMMSLFTSLKRSK